MGGGYLLEDADLRRHLRGLQLPLPLLALQAGEELQRQRLVRDALAKEVAPAQSTQQRLEGPALEAARQGVSHASFVWLFLV